MKVAGCLLVCVSVVLRCNCFSFYYISNPACDGTKNNKHILTTLEDISKTRCVLMCDMKVMCVFVSYDIHTRMCYLQTHTLYEYLTDDTVDTNYICLFAEDYLESWVTSILVSSLSFANYYPMYMKGAPDHIPWITANNSTAFVEFDIAMEMYVERLYIYTVKHVNFSVISLLSPGGYWSSVWSGIQESINPNHFVTFSPELKITNFKTSRFRFDIRRSERTWSIDAVKAVGKENQRLRD